MSDPKNPSGIPKVTQGDHEGRKQLSSKKQVPDPQSHHADVPRAPDLGSFHIQGIKMTDLKQHMMKRMGWNCAVGNCAIPGKN